jgi:hypothetical protein
MKLNRQRLLENVAQAATEDLLDRVTVYREGMEPEALHLIEAELRRRGVTPAELDAHQAKRQATLLLGPDGLPRKCERCWRPAVVEVWGWQRLWHVLPLFPRRMRYCAEHRPAERSPRSG